MLAGAVLPSPPPEPPSPPPEPPPPPPAPGSPPPRLLVCEAETHALPSGAARLPCPDRGTEASAGSHSAPSSNCLTNTQSHQGHSRPRATRKPPAGSSGFHPHPLNSSHPRGGRDHPTFTSCVRTGTPQPSPAHGRLPGPSPTRPPAAASRPAFRCSGSSTQSSGVKLNLKLPHTRDFLPVLLILGTGTPPSTTPR